MYCCDLGFEGPVVLILITTMSVNMQIHLLNEFANFTYGYLTRFHGQLCAGRKTSATDEVTPTFSFVNINMNFNSTFNSF